MPELAEVETVRRTLKERVLNKKIQGVEVNYPSIVENDLSGFKDSLVNKSFIDIKRKGKYLIFETEDSYLVSHLRMEGKFYIKNPEEKIEKHEHVIFSFGDFDLRYHDVRKFGRMKLISKDFLEEYFKDLGPDANSRVDFNYLKAKLNAKKPVKALLLDQSIMAGLGNIYVDEVLYYCKLHPLTLGEKLSTEDIQNIIKYAKEVLDKATELKGTTIRSYTSSLNVYGNYQDYLKVHTKKVCECGNSISKVKVGGRTSYFCDKCQKAK